MYETPGIKVSVIVPVYNTEKYVRKCAESILQQTLEEIELICINDGSTDRSGEILQGYAEKDERVRIIRQENQGQATARNAGIEEAKGEYICFVDSDDSLEAGALEALYRQAAEEKLDVLYFAGNTEYETEEMAGDHKAYFDRAYRRDQEEGKIFTGREMLRMQREKRQFWRSACMCLIRRQFMEDSGIRFRSGVLHEDNLFAFLLCLKAERTASTGAVYYHRLLRDNSTVTTKATQKNLYGYLEAVLDETEQMKDAGDDEAAEALYGAIHDTVRLACETWTELDGEERKALETVLKETERKISERDLYKALIEPQFEGIIEEKRLKQENREQRQEIRTLTDQLRTAREENELLRDSMAFRIGTALLKPFRMFRKG